MPETKRKRTRPSAVYAGIRSQAQVAQILRERGMKMNRGLVAYYEGRALAKLRAALAESRTERGVR